VPGFAEVPDAAVGVACLLQPAKTTIKTKIAMFLIIAHYMPFGWLPACQGGSHHALQFYTAVPGNAFGLHLDYAVSRAFGGMSPTHILIVKGVPSGLDVTSIVLYEQMRVAVFREPLRSKLRSVFRRTGLRWPVALAHRFSTVGLLN
jgi:hypothetical protein